MIIPIIILIIAFHYYYHFDNTKSALKFELRLFFIYINLSNNKFIFHYWFLIEIIMI